MPEELYKVTSVMGRLILDAAGNPTEGYHIDFVTKSGAHGIVEITASQYSRDRGAERLKLEAERLEEILKL